MIYSRTVFSKVYHMDEVKYLNTQQQVLLMGPFIEAVIV